MNREVLIIALGRVSSAIIALLALRISTTVLPSAEFGYMALMLGAQTLATLVVINPVGQWINRHTHDWWDEGSLSERLRSYRPWIGGACLVGALAFLAWSLVQGRSVPLFECGVVALAIFAAVYNGTYVPLLNMLGLRKQFVVVSNLSVTVGLCCSVVFTLHDATASLWLLGQATGLVIGAMLARRLLPQISKMAHSLHAHQLIGRNDYMHFCVPLALATFFMWVLTAGWRFAGEWFWGLDALGQVYVGLTITLQVWTLAESLLMQVFIPLFFRGLVNEDKKGMGILFSNLLNAQLPLYVLLLGATVLCSKALLILFVGSQYHGASSIVTVAAFIEFARVMSNVAGNAAQATHQTKALIAPYGYAVLALLGLLLFNGILGKPVESAVVSLAVGGVLLLAIMLVSMKKLLDWTIHWRRLLLPVMYLVVVCGLNVLLPEVDNVQAAIAIALCTGVVTSLLALIVARRNPDINALLSVKLKGS